MAIAKIKKLEIIGLEKDRDGLLYRLQKMGLIELISAQESAVSIGHMQTIDSANLTGMEDIISFLSAFRKTKPGFGAMFNFKETLYQKEAENIVTTFAYKNFILEVAGLRQSLKNLAQDREHLLQESYLLAPWKKLSIPLDQIHPTLACALFLGVLAGKDYENLLTDCRKMAIDIFCDCIHQDKANVYLSIFCRKEDVEKLELLLKQYCFNFVTMPGRRSTVAERLLEINREILAKDAQARAVKDKIAQLSKSGPKLMIVYDYLANARDRQEADKDLDKQKFTFRISGWVRAKEVKAIEERVLEEFPDAVIFVSEPQGESVPVILENPKLIQPFEFITQIFGMPQYGELDPTPFLAPFFFVYFGFCVSDAGYGLMIFFISWVALKKFPMGPAGRRFFMLFLFCGISTIIAGMLTGGWFGNAIDIASEASPLFLPLKKFKDSLIMLDPMKEPTKLLTIALSMGIFQIWFGNIVAGIGNFKNKRYIDIFLDQVPMLTFLFGLTGIGLGFLRVIDAKNTLIFNYAALIGAIILVLTQGRREKGIGAKLFYGFYNLYSALSGYLSDILSYSRLWALGLVTGVMANTINMISVQFSQIFPSIIPFVDKRAVLRVFLSGMIMVCVFVIGHLVSFLMNLLGAFVHPLRLQFVEFFSKFFKSGGEAFKPFRIKAKYINLN